MTYRFGPFALDSVTRRLTRDGDPVAIADRHLDVLLHLLEHARAVVSKEALVQAAWPDVAVTDNSLEQAISLLRRALAVRGGREIAHGTERGTASAVSIETIPRRGYRLTADVRNEATKHSDAELDLLLAPHRAWLEGRAALESLSVQRVGLAARAFSAAIEAAPDHAPAYVGLANAFAFRFEATRFDEHPRVEALAAAVAHAREACRLQPDSAEAWATLGFVLARARQADDGIAAVRRAIELEPDNWRHALRLAFISWGEARLRGARRTLQLMPGLAMAHWLAATVHVARQAFDAAASELEAGAAAQDRQTEAAMFGAVGLHWLSGLLRLRLGDDRGAEDHFDRELACEGAGHLYARECCAATWYARGAAAFHRGDAAGASSAFAEALHRVARHPLALAAACRTDAPDADELSARLRILTARDALVDVAIASAVRVRALGRTADDGAVCAALCHAPAGPDGWVLPLEPMLRPWIDTPRWAAALAIVGSRAA